MLQKYAIDSNQIACWINPRDFGKHQQCLMFIHGSGSDHTCWSYQYARLHQQFNIVAVDLPGHGSSEGQGENDVDRYCFWIKKLLDNLKLKKPVLIGHSLGAAIALKSSLAWPQDVAGIVPVGGGVKMPVNPLLLDGLKTNPAEAIDLICKFSLAKENREKFFKPLKESMSKASMEVLHGDLTACSKLDLTTDLARITTPALVLCGEEDKMTPPDCSRAIAAGINGSQLCIVAGAGHMVMMEKPLEFNAAVSKFALSLN